MITETKIDNFNSKLKYTKLKYPYCKCKNCPSFFYNALFSGAVRSGKTYNCVKLLKHYEDNKDNIVDEDGNKWDIRIFLISPTTTANPIYKSLKFLDDDDIYESYSDTVLQKIIDDIDETKKETDDYNAYKKAYSNFLKYGEEKIDKLKDDELIILSRFDFEEPDVIFDPKYKNPVINLIVMDDLLGSDAFSKRNQSLFKYYFIRNRHRKICFFILSQSLKSIPKDLRLNCSLFYYGKFKNERIIKEDLYDEVSGVITPEKFLEMFDFINNDEYGSLVIDATKDKIRFSKGFDVCLECT